MWLSQCDGPMVETCLVAMDVRVQISVGLYHNYLILIESDFHPKKLTKGSNFHLLKCFYKNYTLGKGIDVKKIELVFTMSILINVRTIDYNLTVFTNLL